MLPRRPTFVVRVHRVSARTPPLMCWGPCHRCGLAWRLFSAAFFSAPSAAAMLLLLLPLLVLRTVPTWPPRDAAAAERLWPVRPGRRSPSTRGQLQLRTPRAYCRGCCWNACVRRSIPLAPRTPELSYRMQKCMLDWTTNCRGVNSLASCDVVGLGVLGFSPSVGVLLTLIGASPWESSASCFVKRRIFRRQCRRVPALCGP
mmetsp:Transcript_95317/g.308797  ORF Transcript_95317/g.308797 Transcript_95317/m.308797 type:complete len:202 (+) Transcript_95317:4360-4965(+)